MLFLAKACYLSKINILLQGFRMCALCVAITYVQFGQTPCKARTNPTPKSTQVVHVLENLKLQPHGTGACWWQLLQDVQGNMDAVRIHSLLAPCHVSAGWQARRPACARLCVCVRITLIAFSGLPHGTFLDIYVLKIAENVGSKKQTPRMKNIHVPHIGGSD